MNIPFNKPCLTGKESEYILEAVRNGQISGNGVFTKKCHQWFRDKYAFKKCLLTTSCTDALEMAALLIDLKPGDEVIVPSFTFVSSALAFIRESAVIKFVDSREDYPGLNEDQLEQLITDKTKAIIVVHYAGIACDMDSIMELAARYNLFVIEDAAQAIDSYYNGRALGSIGHFGCFSFHETKNIQCGEGGMLVINDERFFERGEIVWEKGTNRTKFFRGEIDKYGWVDTGSSFLPSDLLAAFLLAQAESIEQVQQQRKQLWEQYYQNLKPIADKGFIHLPSIPSYATNNAHMFYILCKNLQQRTGLINHLKQESVLAVFHYQSLHQSGFMKNRIATQQLPFSDLYSDTLLRLPFYFELSLNEIDMICGHIKVFFQTDL
ncbi:MAG TPA: dTDP-4-amino-4,6-dideoxygalactose transaminase [Panacibacter sp.]|nr:dTDP-4-amino-4,6-dideoxygalactose transaminase [Panacibacter sp.]